MTRGGLALVLTLGLMALSGCAPTLQTGLKPDATFSGPRLTDHTFVSFDGARLGLTRWEAAGAPWAVIIGVHGMNDYANAFHMAGPWWAARGVTTLAYDQRGFGRSPARGIWAPDALRVEDLRTITALARARWPQATLAVAGESLGGAIAIEAFASDRPPAADRLILFAPAVWGWSDQPILNRVALVVAASVAPGHVFSPPAWVTRHIWASDNIPELYAMGADPLEILGARADTLEGLVTTMQRAHRQVAGLRPPVLYMYGAHDQVIPAPATLSAVRQLPVGVRTALYPQGWHLLLRDIHADAVWADTLAFIKDPTAPLPSGAAPITASNLAKESRLREVQHPGE